MAKLADITIADKNSLFDSGAAFLLSQQCKVNEVIKPSSDCEIEIKSGSPYVISRIKGASNFSKAFDMAHDTAQMGLDICSGNGIADLSINNAADECLIWWRDNSSQVLRVVFTASLKVSVSADIQVTDKNGKVKPPPLPPPVKYHECLRYFRLSQVADDLFDAYRNMYLAFELLISSKYPKKNGTERKWLEDALKNINKIIPLSKVFRPKGPDIVDEIIDELYEEIRCRLFHAKSSRRRLLPHSLRDRKKVNEGLRSLTRLILLLTKDWLNIRRRGGLLTYAGFDLASSWMKLNPEILISDSAAKLKKDETLSNPAYKSAVVLPAKFAPELSEPGLNTVLGTIDATGIRRFKRVARFALKQKNTLFSVNVLDAKLSCENIDRFEAQIGIQLINLRQPKYLYRS